MSEKKCSESIRKRRRRENTWKRNIKKLAKNEGREYISAAKKIIPAKEFKPVQTCCIKKCFQNIEISQQQDFYNAFWKSAGSYKSQNIMLSGLMKRKPPCTTRETESNVIVWEYDFHFLSCHVPVCKKFLCTLLNIGKGRFATIQKKLINNQSLQDNRGTHNNHILRLTDELKMLIHEHCSSLPHSESHYSRETSKLLYFENSDLTLTKLYKLFIEYYTEKTGDSNSPITETTYSKYFNHNLNFSFKKRRTDV